MSIRIDDENRVRLAGDHVHPFCPDEPMHYSHWHEWAKGHFGGRKGHKQAKCSCGVYVCLAHDSVRQP